jgi:uncharacterized MAPEG superfamily protein
VREEDVTGQAQASDQQRKGDEGTPGGRLEGSTLFVLWVFARAAFHFVYLSSSELGARSLVSIASVVAP